MVSLRESTSVEISWWCDWLKRVFWFNLSHKIFCRVSLWALVTAVPASSAETHKRASSQQYTEGNYNCGADQLSKNADMQTFK